jgi:hypothetical protein
MVVADLVDWVTEEGLGFLPSGEDWRFEDVSGRGDVNYGNVRYLRKKVCACFLERRVGFGYYLILRELYLTSMTYVLTRGN